MDKGTAVEKTAWSGLLRSFANTVRAAYSGTHLFLACGPNSLASHCDAVRATVTLMADSRVEFLDTRVGGAVLRGCSNHPNGAC